MNKAFDKILERLEERTDFLSDCTKYGNKDAEQQGNSYSTMMLYEVADLVEDLKAIVREVAEEYNNGWIACSDRPPSYDGSFICTAKGIEESLELIYSSWDNSWTDEFDSEYEVIAWQSLPKSYQPKGE